MKLYFYPLLLSVFAFSACTPSATTERNHKIDVSGKVATSTMVKSNDVFSTYLPIYSSITAFSAEEKRSLTSTVSIHNMNMNDSLFVKSIDSYNTNGEFVRSYIDQTIFLNPMETVNIIVYQKDNVGGTGANFVINWTINNPAANVPIIEAVMVSTFGQQGISFVTRGLLPYKLNSKKIEIVE